MGGGGETESSTVNKPWAESEFRDAIARSVDLSHQPMEMFQGGFTGAQDRQSADAYRMSGELGTADYRQAATGFLGDTLKGNFMPGAEGNPYLDNISKIIGDRTSQQYQTSTAPQTASRFAGAGRTGSGANQQAISRNEQTLANQLYEGNQNLYYGDYNRRMGERNQALSMVPGLQNLEYQDIGQRRASGGIEEQRNQANIDEDIMRFNFSQNEEGQRLDQLFGRLGQTSNYGSQMTTQSGGGMGGAAIGSSLLGLVGTLGGAALGGPAGAMLGGGLAGLGGGGGGGGAGTGIFDFDFGSAVNAQY